MTGDNEQPASLRPGPCLRREETACPRDECLLARRHDEQVVITLPGDIDMTNSPRIREALLAVGMTAMTFFDSSGMHAVTAARRQAVAAGTDLRVVIGHPSATSIRTQRRRHHHQAPSRTCPRHCQASSAAPGTGAQGRTSCLHARCPCGRHGVPDMRMAEYLSDHREKVAGRWSDLVAAGLRGRTTQEEARRELEDLYTLIIRVLAEADEHAAGELRATLDELSRARARHGFTPTETALGVFTLKEAVYELVADAAEMVPEYLAFSRMIDDQAARGGPVEQPGGRHHGEPHRRRAPERPVAARA